MRPGLAPRDRSLVTVSALIASGHVAQIPYHLNRAMDNGLTQAQAGEVATHLAFYAGWPNVFRHCQGTFLHCCFRALSVLTESIMLRNSFFERRIHAFGDATRSDRTLRGGL
ncbi:carboxymuconolactone decarboxylase family protein [Rhodopila sp.]|uniref:carboxymuconolactone decarboxylase family protein n=1 Tax=Rhodopila sp. TaxID=2480087 RepID=UPI003D0EC55C